jgi:hypothetical protein
MVQINIIITTATKTCCCYRDMAASAHVLYLTSLISSSPTPTCADATTEYVDITNKCLLLHYMWLYAGTLQIFVQDEGRGMHLVTSVTSSEQPHLIGQWRPLFVSLPARQGMHQIVIRALRTSDKYGSGTTGVAIDDITVRYCTDFSKYKALLIPSLTHKHFH